VSKSASIFLAGLVLGAVLAAGGFALVLRSGPVAGASQQRVLKLGHGLEPSHPVHQGMLHLKERLEALSGGTMTLEIYPSSVLGGETECLEQLQNGVLAMTKASSGPLEAFVVEMQVFGLPYLFRDAAHFWQVADSELGRDLLHKGVARNMYGLCYYDAGSRNFYTRVRQIRTPEDLKGLKIRVMNSPMAIKMVEMMGASATPITWGELYSALAQGIVDGAENNPPSFLSNRHYEICKWFSQDAHTRLPDVLLINTAIWQRLTAQQQAWLQQAADESSRFQRELWARKSDEALAEMKRLGVDVFAPDMTPFMQKVEPMYRDYEQTPVGELAARIRAFK
jgi:tripartite ATP-independent transporter DctP family solute receptor